jgi:hypothetical protein
MLELTTNRCDEDESLFGGRKFATRVANILVIKKRVELRMPQMAVRDLFRSSTRQPMGRQFGSSQSPRAATGSRSSR